MSSTTSSASSSSSTCPKRRETISQKMKQKREFIVCGHDHISEESASPSANFVTKISLKIAKNLKSEKSFCKKFKKISTQSVSTQ